jgi:hypothetical protein
MAAEKTVCISETSARKTIYCMMHIRQAVERFALLASRLRFSDLNPTNSVLLHIW